MIALARLRLGLQAAASFAHRKPAVLSGMERRVASPSGNFRPRFGHAPERSGKRSKKAQH